MDGEELPYPTPAVPSQCVKMTGLALASTPLTIEDFNVVRRLRSPLLGWRFRYADAFIMYARTSCTGIKPAMKNLAVFLKYS